MTREFNTSEKYLQAAIQNVARMHDDLSKLANRMTNVTTVDAAAAALIDLAHSTKRVSDLWKDSMSQSAVRATKENDASKGKDWHMINNAASTLLVVARTICGARGIDPCTYDVSDNMVLDAINFAIDEERK